MQKTKEVEPLQMQETEKQIDAHTDVKFIIVLSSSGTSKTSRRDIISEVEFFVLLDFNTLAFWCEPKSNSLSFCCVQGP